MKAIIPVNEVSNATQPQNKETTQVWNLVAYHKGELKEVITCRWYMGRSNPASTVYCCIWVHGQNKWYSGKGNASGYGYHKYSAAFQSAVNSAGITFVGSPYHGTEKEFTEWNGKERVIIKQDFKRNCSVSGCGDTAVEDGMKAIAQALGFKKYIIVKG